MTKEKTNELANADSDVLAKEAVKVLLEKLAINVELFDVKDHTSITDYYVNATGKSSTHVASLADDVVDNFSDRGREAYRIEGRGGNSWLLVDYGSVIVNVFDSEARELYNFNRLLPAECKQNIDALCAEVDEKFSINNVKDV